jgi:hypothetical protein
MSSGHDIVFIKDMVTGDTGGILFDETTGAPVTSIANGATGVTKAFLLSPKGRDYIFTAVCTGCSVSIVSLQMSPDGVNWCDCVLADGGVCSVNCDLTQDCYTKNVDVSVLQYVRLKIGNAGTSTGSCTVRLNYTLN